MNISYKWLKTLIDFDLSPQELAARLTMLGHAVDELLYLGQGIEGVVVGRATALRPHPDADKLRLVTVDYGAGSTLEVVCGAPNVRQGGLYPLALVGTVLPGGFELKKAKIRGVESQGMLCSEKELGLSDESSGLLELDESARPGMPLPEALGLDDWRLVLDITANRGDMWSQIGAARELQPVARHKLTRPESAPADSGPAIESLTSVEITDSQGCPRYMARVIENVTVGPSPRWLVERLNAVGQRSINNVVDITNFILFELGQPLHSFDLDRLEGKRIVVRKAAEGEQILTLDGVPRKLGAAMTVIADAVKPVAVAGVMGDKLSEVDETTRRVLLECAWFDPATNRRTSRALGLSTEASRRFERGVDYSAMPLALDRAAKLIAEVSGGTVARGAIDVYPRKLTPPTVELRSSRAESLLGLEFPDSEVRRCLEGIDFKVETLGAGKYSVTVPACRQDVSREVDLIEELARVRGYEHIPAPARMSVTPAVSGRRDWYDLAKLRECLAGLGLREVMTSSFTGAAEVEAICGAGVYAPPQLSFPLSSEEGLLRPELSVSLLGCVKRNLNQRNQDVRIFEIGRVFPRRAGSSDSPEERRLGLAALGSRQPVHWSGKGRAWDFFDLKGVLESMAARLKLPELSFVQGSHPALHPGKCAEVRLDGHRIGLLGAINPTLASSLELPDTVLLAELDLDPLLGSRQAPRHSERSPYPGSRRDLAVLVDESVPCAELSAEIQRGSRLVAEVSVFDLYQGQHVPAGKKSLAFSMLFQSVERTLRDEEVDQAFERILRGLIKKFDVKQR